MNQKTKKLFVIFVVSLFFAGTFAYKEVYASEEDAILAEFAEDASNLLPENILVSTAEVEIEEVRTRNGITIKTYRKETVTTEMSLPIIEGTEDSGKVAIAPADQAEADLENWGIPALVGNKNYLVKNTTDFESSSHVITDNYDVESYYYILFEGLKSKSDSSQITITVSFATSATETNATLWKNATLVNAEVYPLAQTTWFNLLLSANSTHKYVVHTVCANIDVTGHYIFQFDNNRFVSDTRHDTIYINTDETILTSMKGVQIGDNVFVGYDAHQPTGDEMLILAGTTVDDLNITKMLAVPSQIQRTHDMKVRYQGWTRKSVLEDDLKLSFRQKLLNEGLMTATDRIYDYNVTKMHWQMNLNVGLLKLIRKALEKLLQSSTDYRTLVVSALSQVLPLATITSEDSLPDDLPLEYALQAVDDPFGTVTEGFWSNVGDFFKDVGSGIASVAKKVVDVPLKLIDSCRDLGGKIVQTVGGTATKALNTVGNTINTVTGHVGSAVGSAVGAVKDVGKSLMDTLKWPLIIGVPIAVVVIGVGAYFYVKKR